MRCKNKRTANCKRTCRPNANCAWGQGTRAIWKKLITNQNKGPMQFANAKCNVNMDTSATRKLQLMIAPMKVLLLKYKERTTTIDSYPIQSLSLQCMGAMSTVRGSLSAVPGCATSHWGRACHVFKKCRTSLKPDFAQKLRTTLAPTTSAFLRVEPKHVGARARSGTAVGPSASRT